MRGTAEEACLRGHPVALAAIGYMFVTNLDSIFVIPLLPVLHHGAPGEIARDVALALSLRLGASLLMSLILPAVAPAARNGAILLAASGLKAAAFLVLLMLPAPWGLWCFAVLAGAGTGALRPAVRAAIADDTRGDAQALAFQALFLAMNLAFMAGPLLADAAIRLDMIAPGIIAVAALELGVGLAAFCVLPPHAVSHGEPGCTARLAFTALPARSWLLLAQVVASYAAVGFIIAALVLYESIQPAHGAWRNTLLSSEGFAVILVQLVLMPFFSGLARRHIHASVAIAAACGLVLAFSGSLALAFLGLFIFALAECLAMPIAQLELAEATPARERRRVFALAMVAAASGEVLGTWLAWVAVRGEAAGLSNAAAAQVIGLALGCALAAIGWGLARRVQPGAAGARATHGLARVK